MELDPTGKQDSDTATQTHYKEAEPQDHPVTTNVPQTEQPVATPSPKQKPPVAAQILYALGFLGLIFGLFIALIMVIGSSTSSFSDITTMFGLSSLNTKMAALVFALVVVGLFAMINSIRAGKLWALIAYTTVITLGFASTIIDWLTRSEIEKLLHRGNPIGDFLVYIIVGPLLVSLWTKNRRYFA